MSAVTYAVGLVAAAAVVGAIAWAACSLRARLVPGWRGSPARLVEIVVGLAIVISVAQVLGTFGLFRQWTMFASCIAVALATVFIAKRGGPARVPDRAPARPEHVPLPVISR